MAAFALQKIEVEVKSPAFPDAVEFVASGLLTFTRDDDGEECARNLICGVLRRLYGPR